MAGRNSKVNNNDKKSCCTWPKIVLLIILLAVAGVLIWKFAPVDEAIDSVLPSYNSTDSGDSGSESVNENSPTDSPAVEQQGYQFNQCQDPTSSDCCNGLDTICSLRADEVLYATLHNGMSTFEDGFIFGPNHQFQLEKALDAGYRGLNLDICNCEGQHVFCHGICSLAPRNVDDVMMGVNQFLDNNPSEVIVFVYQVNSDVDQDVDLNAFYDNMLLVDGFVDKIYVHDSPNTTWPTLGELKNSNKRVIMFHYNGPNCLTDGTCPDGLHYYYDYGSDTDWENDSVGMIQDTATSCLLRANAGSDTNTWIGVNNFVSPPSQDAAATLNSYSEAKNRIEACTSILGEGIDVNFFLADFWSEGELPRVTQEHNLARAIQEQQRKQRRHERRNLRVTDEGI